MASLTMADELSSHRPARAPKEVAQWEMDRHLTFEAPRDFGHFRTNRIAVVYISVWSTWTFLILIGMILLYRIRKEPYIKLRNIPLVLSALFFLHVQITWNLLSYPMNGAMPCRLEFWLTTLFLPMGVVLFQAQNMQLLSLFYGQKHLLSNSRRIVDSPSPDFRSSFMPHPLKPRHQRIKEWYKSANYLKKAYIWIGIGSVLIFVSTLTTFLLSRKFNPHGIIGEPSQPYFCRIGWEWFPSAAYTCIWAWIVGPWILWRIRKIKDSHYWKLSTSLSLIFGLPALPLYMLVGIKPAFYLERPYWKPGMWFVPGLMCMEFVIIFFPLYEVHKIRREKAKLRNASREDASLYTMEALEHALAEDCDALEEFAVTKDFTGENIIFLKLVRAWKRLWDNLDERETPRTKADLRMLFEKAEQIWIKTICQDTADYPINITDEEYNALSKIFERPRSYQSGSSRGSPSSSNPNRQESITPFDSPVLEKKAIANVSEKEAFTPPSKTLEDSINDPEWEVNFRRAVPGSFSRGIFDDAEQSIKVLTLENTWLRFVKSQRQPDSQNMPPSITGRLWQARWLGKQPEQAAGETTQPPAGLGIQIPPPAQINHS